jgi:hypothetical protein
LFVFDVVVKAVVLEKSPLPERRVRLFWSGRVCRRDQRVPAQGVSPPLHWVFAIKIEAAGAYG